MHLPGIRIEARTHAVEHQPGLVRNDKLHSFDCILFVQNTGHLAVSQRILIFSRFNEQRDTSRLVFIDIRIRLQTQRTIIAQLHVIHKKNSCTDNLYITVAGKRANPVDSSRQNSVPTR